MSRIPVDVIVVGGGPVGVTTALLMANRGLTVRVIEKSPEIYDLPRAIVMDDEIQRVFQGLGLLEDLLAITTPLAGAEFVKPDGERIMGAELPLDADWPLGHHPSVMYYQPELEAFIRGAAEEAGVELALGTEVTEIDPRPKGVRVLAQGRAGDTQEHRCEWLIAADGASSPIRKALGVPFIDQGFDQDWLVLDAELTRPVPTLPKLVQQICDPVRPATFVVGHGNYRRWEFQLQPGETPEPMLEPSRIWNLLANWLTPDDARLVRAVVYRFHATVADRMRIGRVFLAGDAAHQMPPFLGQGLCSGIRDGVNLAWKLALVHSGQAPESLLDTYDEERSPHAAQTVAHAVDMGRLIDELAGREPSATGLDAGYGGGRPAPHLVSGLLSGDHPLVGRQLPQPMVGGVRLDALLGPGFAVVVRSAEDCADVAADWVSVGARIVEVPRPLLEKHLVPGGAIIVRPDRYVAAVTADEPSLRAATAELLTALA